MPHDQSILAPHLAQLLRKQPGLDLRELDSLDDHDPLLALAQRQSRAQSGLPNLLGNLLVVASGLRAKYDPAPLHLRHPDGALASSAGAFLPERLRAPARHQRAVLARSGAASPSGELTHHHRVKEVGSNRGVKYPAIELHLLTYSLSSTSTPADNSSFIKASTV